jgi:hypothetical protein
LIFKKSPHDKTSGSDERRGSARSFVLRIKHTLGCRRTTARRTRIGPAADHKSSRMPLKKGWRTLLAVMCGSASAPPPVRAFRRFRHRDIFGIDAQACPVRSWAAQAACQRPTARISVRSNPARRVKLLVKPLYSVAELTEIWSYVLRYARSFPPGYERKHHLQVAVSLRSLFRNEEWLRDHVRNDS